MRIKITRQTFVNGEIVEAGKYGNVPDAVAQQLITAGKAVAITDDDDDDDDAGDAADANKQNDGSKSSKK